MKDICEMPRNKPFKCAGEGDQFCCPGLSRNLVEFILIFEISFNLAKYLILNIFNSREKYEEKITT